MTLFFFLLLMASTSSSVAGQVCFKRAMSEVAPEMPGNRAFWIGAGLIGATTGFFFWLTILPHFPLSYIYPIEAVDRIMMAVAASVFLRERLTPRLLLGIGVITGGTMLVSVT
jgi:drug/metabolite transporter (DMT)-like permease